MGRLHIEKDTNSNAEYNMIYYYKPKYAFTFKIHAWNPRNIDSKQIVFKIDK